MQIKVYLAGLVSLLTLSAAIAEPARATTTVEVLGVGTSALWETAALAAYKLAGAGAQHYSVGCASSGATCAEMKDGRVSAIANLPGRIWITWNSSQTEVWAYLQTDSVAATRAFFAAPRAQLVLSSAFLTTPGQNAIPVSYWGKDAAALPAAIYKALNNASPFTAAFTTLLPADAEAAQARTVSDLGYSLSDPVKGPNGFSYQPVEFNISGTDPYTGDPIPASTIIGVGVTPLVFLINRTNANGLGAPGVFTNVTAKNAGDIFNGGFKGAGGCDTAAFDDGGSSNVPVHDLLREPLSAAMNIADIQVFGYPGNSQELGIPFGPTAPPYNPLNATCSLGGGTRIRELTPLQVEQNGIKSTEDSVGYAFFNYGDFAAIAGTSNYGYLQLNSVDPIFSSYTGGDLPNCDFPCPATAGSSFPNIRSGKYTAWEVSRVVTDASGANLTNAEVLVNEMEDIVNSELPDFVPYKQVGGDPGFRFYRSHYEESGQSPNNGLGGQTESGGDIGGCIEPVGPPPGVLNCKQ